MEPVLLSGCAAGQSVTRTILATGGGAATAVASGIDIDLVAPTARVSGVAAGSTYMGTAPAARCAANDALPGASKCTVRLTRTGQTVRFTATAADVAGNTGKPLAPIGCGGPVCRGALQGRAAPGPGRTSVHDHDQHAWQHGAEVPGRVSAERSNKPGRRSTRPGAATAGTIGPPGCRSGRA